MLCVCSLLPLLRAKATQENPSRVINIGSINGEAVSRGGWLRVIKMTQC